MVPHIVGTAIAPGAAMGVEDDGRYGRYGAGLELHKANRIKWESMRCSSTRVTRGLIFKLGSTLITLCGTIGSHNAWFIETERERDTETLAAFCRF